MKAKPPKKSLKKQNNAGLNMQKAKRGLITHPNGGVCTQGGAACQGTQAQGRTGNRVHVAHVLIGRGSLRETRQERGDAGKRGSPHPGGAAVLLRATEHGLRCLLVGKKQHLYFFLYIRHSEFGVVKDNG